MFAPFPTLQQGCQALRWSEALGLGLPSHPQLTLIWEMAGLYFEQRDVSHLGARTSPPFCQNTALLECLAKDLSVPVCKGCQDLSSCLKPLSLQKVNLIFSFFPTVGYI